MKLQNVAHGSNCCSTDRFERGPQAGVDVLGALPAICAKRFVANRSASDRASHSLPPLFSVSIAAAWFAVPRAIPHLAQMDDQLTRLGLIDEDDIVLDEAALSLALLDHPDVVLDTYLEFIENIAVRMSIVGSEAETAGDRAKVLAQVIANEFEFAGDDRTYDDPANADLIRVIDRRRGLPVSLSILYVSAARRLGWTADALDVPGHVLAAIGGSTGPVMIDPFRGGIVVGSEQISALRAATGFSAFASIWQVAAMPNRAILVRLLNNQATRAELEGKGRRALQLYERMTAMAPSYGPAWWERAWLELVDGDLGAARSSLTAMLEISREPKLRDTIRRALHSLGDNS